MMANRLTMAKIDAILTFHSSRHSNREISDLLGVDRGTVGKYVAQAKTQNPPNAPTGSEHD
jgi:IS30 family transposase